MTLKDDVTKLKSIYENVEKFELDLSKPVMASLDFNVCRQNLYIQEWKNQVKRISEVVFKLDHEEIDSQSKNEMLKLLDDFSKGQLVSQGMIDDLVDLISKVKQVEKKSIKVPLCIPTDIYAEVEMDVNELSKCYSAGCFRSCVIICGRIMEVALHRKYFDVTGNDLLEKNPGIGLGNLIAKMKDKNIEFDPGITQQIHLVNQVRIFSVHKKQQPFYPTKQQTYAMILYTMDILEKIFK